MMRVVLMVVWLSYAIGLLKNLMAFKGFGSNDSQLQDLWFWLILLVK